MIGKFKEFEAIACAVEAVKTLTYRKKEITVENFTEEIQFLKYLDDYGMMDWDSNLPPENEIEIQDY